MALQFFGDEAMVQVFLCGISKPLAEKLKMWECTAPHADEYVHYAQCCQQQSYPSQCNSTESGVSFCGEILKSDC